ncbi:hypothetical protein SAMN05660236_0156 [Ohtaekwangia koreensis]|uniref:Vitellogenin II n=2 Tax=Ohtaekwangia koreensis TaxID=688867 RepID=A0A1T5ILG7_9BACT|nr:hypothetical protein SAMN05660236_0156 [Ohtaekwangia koreensis]
MIVRIVDTNSKGAMKTKILLSLGLVVFASAAFAQVENDDMYFNSKDRAKLKEQKAAEQQAYAATVKKTKKMEEVSDANDSYVNPTDSYSARNVNPEFAARSNAEVAQEDNQDYYLNDYQYQTTSNLNNWNNNFNSWYSNPWYNSAYFGPSINNWNSPYYGYNNAAYSPWYDPYWNNSGWSTSFSYYWGSSWNYGWGGNYNYWNRPYCGGSWASAWGPSYYGSGYYGGYPSTVVIVNNGEGSGRNVSYGKRGGAGRSNTMVSSERYNTSRTRSTEAGRSTANTTTSTSGRTPSLSTNNSNSSNNNEYYNRSWRSRSSSSGSGTTQNSSNNTTNWSTPSRSGNSFDNNRSNNTYTPPSRSSSSFDGGGRSSGSSSGGSSSGGSRGRTRN